MNGFFCKGGENVYVNVLVNESNKWAKNKYLNLNFLSYVLYCYTR